MIIEVDKNDNFLCLRAREDFYSGNHIHRASQLILLDPENRMLLQKRSPAKFWFPNRYTYSVSGTVAGESYEVCMEREMLEELGISVPFRRLLKSLISGNKGALPYIFTGRVRETAHLIRFDPEEAVSIEWIGLEELHRAVETEQGKYTPSLRAGIMKIFEEGCEKYLF